MKLTDLDLRGSSGGLINRFWSHVDNEAKTEDECWLWQGHKTKGNYGIFSVIIIDSGRKRVLTQKMAWLLTHNELPDGAHVGHFCGVHSCVRPDHLWISYGVSRQYRERLNHRIKVFEGKCPRCGSETDIDYVLCVKCRNASALRVQRVYPRRMIRKKALSGYEIDNVSRCNCCGLTDIDVLDVHHINGNGKKEASANVCKRIIREQWPDDVEILCRNCHRSKHMNGGVCQLSHCK
jgi:hypothetical protein